MSATGVTAFEEDAFRPRFPWMGGDLQTIRNALLNPSIDLSGWRAETLRFPMPDGSDDVLIASVSYPAADVALPLVILIHGLTGCEDSVYVRASARAMLFAGFPVMRLNLRGAGPSLRLCHEQYFAGRSEDFREVLRQLPERLCRSGIAAVGYSLGGNMLLKYLGEVGGGTPLVAAASVSAPIDLAATSARFHRRRNYIYKRYLLDRMKKDAALARGGLPERFRDAVRKSRTIREYDDVYVAPRYGFGDADRYYAACSAVRFMPAIETPTLVMHARNDPWISTPPYERFAWKKAPFLVPLLQDGGGHVGFHQRGFQTTWHDAQIIRFFRQSIGRST